MLDTKFRILIVDDEAEIVKTLCNYFSLEGYLVCTASNAHDALELVKKGDIHMVISDIVMPGMDGVDLLIEIKKFNGLIQVVMITGYVKMYNILRAFSSGASNCIFKPFESLDSLRSEVELAVTRLARIKQVLSERRLRQEDDNTKQNLAS